MAELPTPYSNWAASERASLQEDLRWLKAGGKVFSPSGDDVTAEKITNLEARIKHTTQAIEWAIQNGHEEEGS